MVALRPCLVAPLPCESLGLSGEFPRLEELASWRKVRVLSESSSGKVSVMSCAEGGRLAQDLRELPRCFVAKSLRREAAAGAPGRLRRGAGEPHVALFVGRLHARYIVEVFGVVEDDKRYYIAMENCGRGDLHPYMDRTGACKDEGRLREVATQLLTALQTMHDAGVAHLDVCLENLLVHEDGCLRLADFSEAIFVDDEASEAKPYRTPFPGKLHYRPPEAWRDGACSATKQDIFAVGVVLYILLVGEYPFKSLADLSELFPPGEADSGLCKPLACRLEARLGKSQTVSPVLVDFLQELLAPSFEKRPSAEEALRHPWLLGTLDGEWQAMERGEAEAPAGIPDAYQAPDVAEPASIADASVPKDLSNL